MKKGIIINLSIIILLTALLTGFFYWHETFPKSIRAMTALLGTPTAIASGLSYYLNLGIPIYDRPIAVIFSNLIASTLIVLIGAKFLKWRNRKKHYYEKKD